jgi:hypothetical protein
LKSNWALVPWRRGAAGRQVSGARMLTYGWWQMWVVRGFDVLQRPLVCLFVY